MTKDWLVDLIVGVVTVLWMGWTFATIQETGASLQLILPALAIGFLGILMIYGHRISYLRLGDFVLVELDHRRQAPRESEEQDRERNR